MHVGTTWKHRPHNYLAVGAIAPIAPMESAPMAPGERKSPPRLKILPNLQFFAVLNSVECHGTICRQKPERQYLFTRQISLLLWIYGKYILAYSGTAIVVQFDRNISHSICSCCSRISQKRFPKWRPASILIFFGSYSGRRPHAK